MVEERAIEEALDRVHDAMERARLLAWIGQVDEASKELLRLRFGRSSQVLALGQTAFEERQAVQREARKQRRLSSDEDSAASPQRINWEKQRQEARKREEVARDISKAGIYESPASALIPTAAALRSLERRLKEEESEWEQVHRLRRTRAKSKVAEEDESEGAEEPETIGDFRFLILPLGEERYEARLLNLDLADELFTRENPPVYDFPSDVHVTWLNKHEKLVSTPCFRLRGDGWTAHFYVHSRGVVRATVEAGLPAELVPILKIGLRGVGVIPRD